MIFLSFRKRNNSQKNPNTVYSEYSYSGMVPKERTLSFKQLYKDAREVPLKIDSIVFKVASIYNLAWPFVVKDSYLQFQEISKVFWGTR